MSFEKEVYKYIWNKYILFVKKTYPARPTGYKVFKIIYLEQVVGTKLLNVE